MSRFGRTLRPVLILVMQPALAIAPIRSAMHRLDPTTGTFTQLHLSFVRICMETRSYAAAVPILNNHIHSLPSIIPRVVRESLEYSVPAADLPNSGEYIHAATSHSSGSGHTEKITVTDLQEYYVLGAMAYIGLHQYKRAKQFLEHVLVVPSLNIANGLMLEAYKKWVLVSCLVDGSVGCNNYKEGHELITARLVRCPELRTELLSKQSKLRQKPMKLLEMRLNG
jgi:COP9 signalosome complex subunit 3